MDRFQYLGLMAACLLITLPLEFVFRVRVWRNPRRLLQTLAPIVAVFVIWDLYAIWRGHWDFDARYITGVFIPGGIPLEELVFFCAIPICAILTFETARRNLER